MQEWSVGRLHRGMAAPDRVEEFDKCRLSLVELPTYLAGLAVYEPGWRWSESMAGEQPAGSCRKRHVGYLLRGRTHVALDDGQEYEIGAGEVFEIPPGHDVWVVGDEVAIAVGFRPHSEATPTGQDT
jgi:hypothetical protein